MLKGLTDLPITLIAFIFAILLVKKTDKQWTILFFLIAVGGLLGTVVHTFALPVLINRLIWIVLYLILLEIVRRFALIMVWCASGEKQKERISVYVAECIMYAVTLILLFRDSIDSIYVFVVFAALIFVKMAVAMLKFRRTTLKVNLFVVGLLVPLLLQAVSDFLPYAVVYEHIAIVVEMFVAFSLARDMTKQ